MTAYTTQGLKLVCFTAVGVAVALLLSGDVRPSQTNWLLLPICVAVAFFVTTASERLLARLYRSMRRRSSTDRT